MTTLATTTQAVPSLLGVPTTTTLPGPFPGSANGQPLYVDNEKFSNPLYFKTVLVPILAVWPLTLITLAIYLYNIFSKNMINTYRVSIKMNFFPMLLFPIIIDNVYDYVSNVDVKKYDSKTLVFLIVLQGILGFFSMIFTLMYTWEAVKKGSSSLEEDEAVLYTRLKTSEEGDEGAVNLPSNLRFPGRWKTIMNEYLTMNVVWGLTINNLMLFIVYVMRYITYNDNMLMREIDVTAISLAIGLVLIPLVIIDIWLFAYPATASLSMHYYILAVYAINFTVEYYNALLSVSPAPALTILVAFLFFVIKLMAFSQLGRKAKAD